MFWACNPKHIFFLLYHQHFFGNLVNDTFSNLKLNVFMITCFIVVTKRLIIAGSPLLYKEEWDWSFAYSLKNWGRAYLSPRKEEVEKIVEAWKLRRESNLWLVLIFVFIKPRNITIQSQAIYIRVTSFNT